LNLGCPVMTRILFLSLCLTAASPLRGEPVDFQREVRPILSDACYHCHGPDKDSRMANLRLDQPKDALAPRKSGAAIVPGNAEKSLVWQRINHKFAALRMPPVAAHKTLSEDQKATLKRWIDEGAKYDQHWSFRKPVRPPLPTVKNPAWTRNPIDRFLLARLDAAGLAPAPEAPRHTLIRRAALDLTGLPPSPADVDAFLNDPAPDAYERMIDRYLASPHYGEHRARYWLDAARYADTHGIHIDNRREMWPWRDWVINAFNRNMPFDQFTIEQLAGDLLPNRTLEQQIATGFHRNAPTTNEAGAIEAEFAAIYAKDRADTTSAVWLGLTVGCATCHDHKFDPITQRDFYALTAFFNNTTQPVMDGNIADTPPVIPVPNPDDRPRWDAIDTLHRDLRLKLATARNTPTPAFTAWLRSPARRHPAFPFEPGHHLFNLNAPQTPATPGIYLGDSDTPALPALHFTGQARLELPNVAAIRADRPFSVAAYVLAPPAEGRFVIASQSDPAGKNRGWAIDVSGRVPGMRITGDDGVSINVRGGFLVQMKPGTWNHLVFSYDGAGHPASISLYLNGREVEIASRSDEAPSITGSINTGQPLLIGNEAKTFFDKGAIAALHILDRAVGEEEARALAAWPLVLNARDKAPSALSPAERDALHIHYLLRHDTPFRAWVAQRNETSRLRNQIARRSPITHVMEERPGQAPSAPLLVRGMYDQPGDLLAPDVPSILPRLKPGMPRNRLGLAQWLLDEDNPLTARVTVNRIWQEIFGRGFVPTAEDFGSQGEMPSHPELLDWLAVDLRESGWDLKRFYRLLLTSAAYRQAALTTPEKLKADPDNRLLSRGPRFRMDGEMVRDTALAASGLLVPAIGGRSVRPYQPEGVWEAVAMNGSNTRFYKPDQDEGLYRRSMYWFWKRSAPPASLDIFNAPTRELCTIQRERTNTPLQALVTMNDVQFVEAARHLAQRALRSGARDPLAQFDFLGRAVLGRSFEPAEKDILRRAHRKFLSHYDSHPADAQKLLATGASPRDEQLSAVELAALTMVANQVLNLDEALNK
jgi:hypothetical protein